MARIRAMIAPLLFIGTANGDRFRFRRDIRYRNSFLPVVLGRVTTVPTGVRVDVIMFLHPIVAVFMLVWFSGVGYAVGLTAWTLLRTPRDAPIGFLVAMAILVFGVVLVGTGFFSEAREARRLLEQALATPQERAAASKE